MAGESLENPIRINDDNGIKKADFGFIRSLFESKADGKTEAEAKQDAKFPVYPATNASPGYFKLHPGYATESTNTNFLQCWR